MKNARLKPLGSVGLDFGTTNSALAVIGEDGRPQLARYTLAHERWSTFRSILYFAQDRLDAQRQPWPYAGPEAILQYLEAEEIGRLMQSMKSYLSSRSFQATQVFHKVYTLEALVAFIIRDLMGAATEGLGPIVPRVVAGRPVHFTENAGGTDALAESRLRSALELAGLEVVAFELEPVAAALHYEQDLTQDELVLIADFGGGTSDFCLLWVGPDARRGPSRERIVGTAGVGVAGDAFDARLIRHVVAPELGMGTAYRALFTEEEQMVPGWIYQQLRRWHQLAFMKSRRNMKLLTEIRDQAVEPHRIQALIHLIQDDLGFHLYRAIEQAKVALSTEEETLLRFVDPPVQIAQKVTRADFETWISPELEAISACVDRLLEAHHVDIGTVDRVFLTGGSSYVPAVRRIFESRFGRARVRIGDAFTAVASGLALRARKLEEEAGQ